MTLGVPDCATAACGLASSANTNRIARSCLAGIWPRRVPAAASTIWPPAATPPSVLVLRLKLGETGRQCPTASLCSQVDEKHLHEPARHKARDHADARLG